MLRNYKFETLFHVAAKNNAWESLEYICGKNVFLPHLVKRDYKGDTCFHAAAKSGSFECLEWLLAAVTSANFMEIENDFGQTPLQAAEQKSKLINEILSSKQESDQISHLQKLLYKKKLTNISKVCDLLTSFNSWITPSAWDNRFDIKLTLFLEQTASANMRIFMGMPRAEDLKVKAAAASMFKTNPEATIEMS